MADFVLTELIQGLLTSDQVQIAGRPLNTHIEPEQQVAERAQTQTSSCVLEDLLALESVG